MDDFQVPEVILPPRAEAGSGSEHTDRKEWDVKGLKGPAR